MDKNYIETLIEKGEGQDLEFIAITKGNAKYKNETQNETKKRI